MPKSFADQAVAAKMRDTIERIVRRVIEAERPVDTLAALQAIPAAGATQANVIEIGQTSAKNISFGSVVPGGPVGQIVRIGGPRKDRHITDIVTGTATSPSPPTPPNVRTFSTGTPSVASGSYFTVKWVYPDEDTDNGLNISTGLYTFQTPGLWNFTASTAWALLGNAGLVEMRWTGTAVGNYQCYATGYNDGFGYASLSQRFRVIAGQTLGVQAAQFSGSARSMLGSTTSITGIWQGP